MIKKIILYTKTILLVALFSFLSMVNTGSTKTLGEKEKLVNEIMEKSGINEQVKEIPNIVKVLIPAQLATYNAVNQPKISSFIEKKMYKYFVATRILRTISSELNKNFNKSNIEALLKWFNSSLGEKITELEVKATTPDAALEIMSYSVKMKEQPPDKRRLKLVKKLIEILNLGDHTAKKTGAIIFEMAKGMNQSLPENRRISDEQIMQLNHNMEKSMVSQINLILVATFLYTYDSLSLEELEKYVEFLGTGSSKWFNEVYLVASISAIEESSFDFGLALGKEIATIPMPQGRKDIQWQKYSSTDGEFTVEFPGNPKSNNQSFPGERGPIIMNMLLVENRKMAFVLTFVKDFPPLIVKKMPLEQLVNNMLKGSAKNVGGQIIKKKFIKYQGYPGVDYTVSIQNNSGVIQSRVVFVKHKYYQLLVTGKSDDKNSIECERFLNSLKIVK